MMFLSRSTQPEIMDDVSIRDARLDNALRELTVINTWLGGDTVTRNGIAGLLRHVPPKSEVSILDVGAGGSDLNRTISTIGRPVNVTALDLNFRACQYSLNAFPAIQAVNGSVLHLPFKDNSFDIVHASLFLHHFAGKEPEKIIASLYRISRYGIVINDLRRSLFAYIGITALTQLFSRSAMVKNDAPVSVLRGFVYNELKQLCHSVPSASVSIKRMWAFRWCVYIVKKNE